MDMIKLISIWWQGHVVILNIQALFVICVCFQNATSIPRRAYQGNNLTLSWKLDVNNPVLDRDRGQTMFVSKLSVLNVTSTLITVRQVGVLLRDLQFDVGPNMQYSNKLVRNHDNRASLTVTGNSTSGIVEFSMLIVNTTLEDAGEYRVQLCEGRRFPLRGNCSGPELSLPEFGHIFIWGKPSTPSVTNSNGQLSIVEEVNEGEVLSLHCDSTSTSQPAKYRPAVKFTWLKYLNVDADSRYILEGDSLVIKNVTRWDHGVFSCKAHEDGSVVSSEESNRVTITVMYKPGNAITLPLVAVKHNKTVPLACTTEYEGNPRGELKWTRGGVTLTSDRRGVLVLKRVQESDAGEYVCTPYNDIGESKVATVRVRVTTQTDTNSRQTGQEDNLPRNQQSIVIGVLSVFCALLVAALVVTTVVITLRFRRTNKPKEDLPVADEDHQYTALDLPVSRSAGRNPEVEADDSLYQNTSMNARSRVVKTVDVDNNESLYEDV